MTGFKLRGGGRIGCFSDLSFFLARRGIGVDHASDIVAPRCTRTDVEDCRFNESVRGTAPIRSLSLVDKTILNSHGHRIHSRVRIADVARAIGAGLDRIRPNLS